MLVEVHVHFNIQTNKKVPDKSLLYAFAVFLKVFKYMKEGRLDSVWIFNLTHLLCSTRKYFSQLFIEGRGNKMPLWFYPEKLFNLNEWTSSKFGENFGLTMLTKCHFTENIKILCLVGRK